MGDPEPEAGDRTRRRVMWKMPSGLYLIGSAAGERLNAMTASWVTQLSSTPKLVGVGVEMEAVTLELIRAGGAFSVNLLARSDRAVIRRFVKPAETDPAAGTLGGQPFHRLASGAPVLDVALAWLDCRLERQVELGSHVLVVGEVTAAGFQADEDTPVLRMEDTRMNYGG